MRTPARPRTVTIVAVLLVVQAILGLVGLAMSFALRDVLGGEATTANAIAKQFAGGATTTSLFGVGCSVLLAITCLVLAAFLVRGANPARVAAWVFSAIGVFGFAVSNIYSAPSAVKQPVPQWYLEYSGAASLLVLAIYAAIIVLALRPSTNEYFAKRTA
jgi:preprotein translocase subunit Sss1